MSIEQLDPKQIEALKEIASNYEQLRIQLLANKVFKEHPTYQRITQQIEKGIAKYETPVNDSHYTLLEWNEHQQEELTDAIVYTDMINVKLTKIKQLAELIKMTNSKTSIERMAKEIIELIG